MRQMTSYFVAPCGQRQEEFEPPSPSVGLNVGASDVLQIWSESVLAFFEREGLFLKRKLTALSEVRTRPINNSNETIRSWNVCPSRNQNEVQRYVRVCLVTPMDALFFVLWKLMDSLLGRSAILGYTSPPSLIFGILNTSHLQGMYTVPIPTHI